MFPDWHITGDSSFDNGRLILTPKPNSKGSLTNDLEVSYDSWTIETIIRSAGAAGKTGSGASLRVVANHGSDTSFFGGPGKFDGLNIVVDSDGPTGSAIRGYLNDGTVDFSTLGDKTYDNSFGSCLATYQDSQVPFTLRAVYYNGILTVQVDNKVCFKTKQVKLPKNYKVGFSAATGSQHEQFELLRLKTYGGVLSEVLDNDNIAANQPKVITQYVQLGKDGKSETKVDKPVLDSTTRPDTGDNTHISDLLTTIDQIQASNKELLKNFVQIDNKLTGLSITSSGQKPDLSYLEEYTGKVKVLSDRVSSLESKVSQMESKVSNLETLLRREIASLSNTVNKASSDNINQLRETEHSIEELNKQIQYLVYSEKDRQENPISDLVSNLKFLIIPILVLIVVLIMFTYRLRHDIKTKLL